MAQKKGTGKTNAAKGRSSSGKKSNTSANAGREQGQNGFQFEIILIVSCAIAVFLELSNFGVCGKIGNAISGFLFGLFGVTQYILPLVVFVGMAFLFANGFSSLAVKKVIYAAVLLLNIGMLAQLIAKLPDGITLGEIYQNSMNYKNGGGFFGGGIALLLKSGIGVVGTYLVILVLTIIMLVLLTEKSLLHMLQSGGSKMLDGFRDVKERGQDYQERRQEEKMTLDEVRAAKRAEREAAKQEKQERKQSELDERRAAREDKKAKAELEREKALLEQRQEAEYNRFHKKTDKMVTKNLTVFPEGGEQGKVKQNEFKQKSPLQEQEIHEITMTFAEPEDADETGTQEMNGSGIRSSSGTSGGAFESKAESAAGLPENQTAKTNNRQAADREIHREVSKAGKTSYSYKNENLSANAGAEQNSKVTADPFSKSGAEPVTNLAGAPFSKTVAEQTAVSSEEESFTGYPKQEDKPVVKPIHTAPASMLQQTEISRADREKFAESGEEFSPVMDEAQAKKRNVKHTQQSAKDAAIATAEVTAQIKRDEQQRGAEEGYRLPPLDLLTKGAGMTADNESYIHETIEKLQTTLNSFGVGATVTDYSCGPAVTRFELQPEQGVKVSKIVGLSDDIKLALAATDIRIEAPIPGKAAVGIEIPNRENSPVLLRDLLEDPAFQASSSKIAFAAGKDIAGQTVIADIAKMPHLLIAGSTGSGKSVCINTIIMSILFKADPKDVKLIMIDPKVVELTAYNGIPHLLIPVVTDAKKAAGALNWAVQEMTKRYQLFAEYNVRNLKGYNKKVEDTIAELGITEEESDIKTMSQIVVIVDELADLMMVAKGEVEDAIVRLAQLARAAGIHLIIATQRPSVDVITGLIKANVPSRIAFAVSSFVDSKTILDMGGAEKLLGKGDMLFYPTGYPKPVRVQGAFVSDEEVSDVVSFLKENVENQASGSDVSSQIESDIAAASVAKSSGGEAGDDRDEYFRTAAELVIDSDKASIGMLQRRLKIGFNRAARIMDQLAEEGIVGPDEGTKPRQILMSKEQFEQYVEEYL